MDPFCAGIHMSLADIAFSYALGFLYDQMAVCQSFIDTKPV